MKHILHIRNVKKEATFVHLNLLRLKFNTAIDSFEAVPRVMVIRLI